MDLSIDAVIKNVRAAVRAERAYHVGVPEQVDVKLNQNENPFELPEALRLEFAEIASSLAHNRYPSEFPGDLIRVISETHGFDEDGLIVGHGSNELSHFLALCVIDAGTPVVLPRPMFSLYESVVRLFAADVHQVDCRPDLSFDVDALVDRIEEFGPRLTIIASPNNPTGLPVAVNDIRRILEAGDGIVLVDEAYIEFAPEFSVASLLDQYPNLLILRTLSKAFGMAGIRIGYLAGHPSLIHEMKKARLPFMIGRHDEQCAMALLRREDLVSEWIDRMKTEIAWMAKQLNDIPGVRTLPTVANFFLFETTEDPAALADTLGSMKIAVRKMSSYPELQSVLRVCAGIPTENQRFVEALKNCLEQNAKA